MDAFAWIHAAGVGMISLDSIMPSCLTIRHQKASEISGFTRWR